jgi:hypothetical protein
MIALLPRDMPAFEVLLDNIGSPHPDRLASSLGVSRRTVYRWFETGAPRLASLAIWPLTRWGASVDATRAAERPRPGRSPRTRPAARCRNTAPQDCLP